MINFALTLVASDLPLSAGHIARAEKFLEQNGILMMGAPTWLKANKAADLIIAECLTMEQMIDLRTVFEQDRIDLFCTSTDNRRKNLLLADMDSTIVTSETLDELADKAGIKDKIAKITEAAMRGELDFHEALIRRVSFLEGLSIDALKETLEETQISDGAQKLVSTMRHDGAFCVLVSGGFTYFTSEISAKLGFTAHHGNQLEISDEKMTGKVIEPILDKESKLRYLNLYCEELDIDLSDTVAIGDGANDLPMLETAGLGIGYHPKPLLEQSLLNCIRFGDLTAALYAQGYQDIT